MVIALLGGLGLVVGAGLALLAEFVPDNSGGGRSPLQCRSCDKALPSAALLPVRTVATACEACDKQVSAGRLAVVLTTGVVFAVSSAVVGARWQLIPILVLGGSLIALSAVDIERYRLPDRLLFPSLGLSAVMIAVLSISSGDTDHVLRAVLTALAYSGILLVFNIISPAGLAFGDVKLALLLGLFLGWSADTGLDAFRLIIWALLAGMLLGILSGLVVGVGRRVIGPNFLPDPDFPIAEGDELDPLLKTAFPFGPALAVSTFGLVLFSNQILAGTGILA